MRKNKTSERRVDQRAPAPELDALYSTEREQKKVRIKDISATGLYFLTNDPPQPGTDVELTLQKSSLTEPEQEQAQELLDLRDEDRPVNVHLRGRAVRVDQDGVGIAFEPASPAANWIRIVGVVANLTGDTDRVRLFRMSKALDFLFRVSPEAEADLLEMVASRMSLVQIARAVEIALMADEIASALQGDLRHDVSSKLVLRILEDGSKVDEEQTRRMWAELLAASCHKDAKDVVSLNDAAILSRIDAVQMRILNAACKLAMQVGWEKEFRFHQDMHCGAEEIKRITHIQNLMGIERDLNHLFELGLLELTDRPVLCQQVERVNMAPTFLALRLHARCKGLPEPPDTLEGAELQRAS